MRIAENVERTAAASPAEAGGRIPLWLILLGVAAALCVVAMAITLLLPAGRATAVLETVLDDPAIAFAVAALLFARSRSRSRTRTVWGLLAAGVACWLAGELIFDVRELLGASSDASVADVFYLLYYVPVMAGMYLLGRRDRRAHGAGQSLDVPIIMAGTGLLLWAVVRQSAITATGSLTTQALDVAYVALDLGLLWLLILPLVRSDTPWTRARVLMAGGLFGILLADTVWVAVHSGLYGLIASSSMLLLGVAALHHPRLVENDVAPGTRHRTLAELAVVVAGVASLLMLDWLALNDGLRLDLVLGASAVLALVLARLRFTIVTNERLLRASERRASTDPLSGLLNHGSFHEHLDRELARAGREREPLTLLFVDLDHLKSVNDLAGHRAGDRVIVQLAELLRTTCRETDLVCRTGGDEMAVIAPATDLAQAGELARRLLQAAHGIRVETLSAEAQLSLSIGASVFPHPATTKVELIEQADAALYEAKRRGRDRWCGFDPRAGRQGGRPRPRRQRLQRGQRGGHPSPPKPIS